MIWKVIPDFPNYEVSEYGDVRRISGGRWNKPGKVLKSRANERGYLRVNLYNEHGPAGRFVHRLVASAFIGGRPEGYQVAHGDGNPSSNHYSNLRYATVSENYSDRITHGTDLRGETTPVSKLKNREVIEILTSDERPKVLSDRFGVSEQTISNIRLGKTWKHVTGRAA